MSKPRGTTLQAKFGFQDHELSTPAHDALMIWLDKKVGEREFLSRVGDRLLGEWPHQEEFGDRPAATVDNVIWEYPITTNRSRFTVGFADLLLRLSIYTGVDTHCAENDEYLDTKTTDVFRHADGTICDHERKYTRRDGIMSHRCTVTDEIVPKSMEELFYHQDGGYGLCTHDTKLMAYATGHNIFFEVKPSIRSAGETIRQIRLYQEHTPDRQNGCHWAIVSPDDTFAHIFRRQGIHFMKAPKV